MLKCVNLFWEVLHSWVNHWILKTLGGSESHFVLLALLPCFKNLSSCPKFAFRIFHGSIIFWWILFNNENENFVRPTSQVLIFYEMLHLSGKTNYFIQKFLASSNKRNKTDTNYQSWNVSRRYIGLNSKTHSLKDLLNITCSTVYTYFEIIPYFPNNYFKLSYISEGRGKSQLKGNSSRGNQMHIIL